VTEANAGPATTQPAGFDAIAEYGKLEDQFVVVNKMPIGQQPLPDLVTGYQKVIASDDLPSSMRSIAEIRLATLKARNDAREKFLAVEENQKKMTAQRQALSAERQEIEEAHQEERHSGLRRRRHPAPVEPSDRPGMLYRLTDPASGRTVCYLRTTEPKYGPLLGQFIGVRGRSPAIHSLSR